MVVGVNPVPNVFTLAIKLRSNSIDDVGDLTGDELFYVLVRAVVVRAVADRRLKTERPDPCPDKQIRACLGGGVRARRVVRSFLCETLRIIELEVPVDLVCGDVVEPLLVLPGCLDQRVSSDDVRVQKGARIMQGIVVM